MKLYRYLLQDAPQPASDSELLSWALKQPAVVKWFTASIRRALVPVRTGTAGRPRVDESVFLDEMRKLGLGPENAVSRSVMIRAMNSVAPVSATTARGIIKRLVESGQMASRRGDLDWEPIKVWWITPPAGDDMEVET